MFASSSYRTFDSIAFDRGYQITPATMAFRQEFPSNLPIGTYVAQHEIDWSTPRITMTLHPADYAAIQEAQEALDIEVKPVQKRNPNGYRQRKLKARLNQLPKQR